MRLSVERTVVIPNGCCAIPHASPIDRNLRSELNLPADAVIFLNVGSLCPVKAQHVLVEAFCRMASENSRTHLILVGTLRDGAYVTRIANRIKIAGLENRIHLLGRRTDVHRFLNAARALVMPSFTEGWSLAISEAVQCGTPVVATDVGGALEQLRGTGGVLLPSPFPIWKNLRIEDVLRAATLEPPPHEILEPLDAHYVDSPQRRRAEVFRHSIFISHCGLKQRMSDIVCSSEPFSEDRLLRWRGVGPIFHKSSRDTYEDPPT
jgi:glycosyltransferase involved in cell wall biosynthesis